MVRQAGLTVLSADSIKSAIDIDWDDDEAQREALNRLLEQVSQLEAWVAKKAAKESSVPPLKDALAAKATGSAGHVFFGSPNVLEDRPVTAEVKLPGGSWQLLARPNNGWAAALPSPWGFRGLILLGSMLVLVPLFVARFLIGERQEHIRTLGDREHQLKVLSRRLGLALDTSMVGVFEYNIDTDVLV